MRMPECATFAGVGYLENAECQIDRTIELEPIQPDRKQEDGVGIMERWARLGVAVGVSLLMTNSPVFGEQQAPGQAEAVKKTRDERLADILVYISSSWNTLTRSMTDCVSIVDPKVAGKSVLYVPFGYHVPQAVEELQSHCNVEVKHLPKPIASLGEVDPAVLESDGLLYLEHPYVVPGGRFNEMYGWDSYFIIRGLLRDGRTELAQGMVDNFLFEIDHYGAVLNANRTYYLTRSQPPFLSSMILAVYGAERAGHAENKEWLRKAFNAAKKDYGMWMHGEHLAGTTGLSRYYGYGDGPTPESLKDETDHYKKVAAFFVGHTEDRAEYQLVTPENPAGQPAEGRSYEVQVCGVAAGAIGKSCEPAESIALSGDFYKGDRAMRESGFDITFRFGAYGAETHHYAPVCLNSLLYKTEMDFARISEMLGDSKEAGEWRKKAESRGEKIQKYMWNEKSGMFFDLKIQPEKQSDYIYVTTFYPLWVGLATKEEARRVVENLPLFEKAGGLTTSTQLTGAQWDAPNAWAPLQLLALEGLRRYGYDKDADRIADKFLSMVLEDFERDGTIHEKYDAETRTSRVKVTAGYQTNVVGFGWTNGVFLELLHEQTSKNADGLLR